MLVELSVQRIALIESVHLRLSPGLTVFTGETGAGKSILLDAIGLLLGNRASSEWIRTGEQNAVVEAMFHLRGRAQETVASKLSAWGIDGSSDEILVSRELQRSGRAVCRINGRMATVQMLRELGETLVQQHGQHEHQGLLQADEQRRMLDLYAKHHDLLDRVREAYEAFRAANQSLRKLRMDEQERMRRLDMLAFQINEIEEADLRPGEEDELRQQRERLQHAGRTLQQVKRATEALEGHEHNSGAVSLLVSAGQFVQTAVPYDKSLEDALTMLETAHVHADEALRYLEKYLSTVDEDPEELERVENRLVLIRGLERKYGPSVEDVLAHYRDAVTERDTLLHHEERIHDAEKEVQACAKRYTELADALHERRLLAAEKLASAIENVLHELNMPSASLAIPVTRKQNSAGEDVFHPDGMDDVVFLFRANRGEELKPLQKIASGGELSRTLLAFKAVLAEVDDMDTLIFDEIDTGVSGSAAERIADQLRQLGAARQVLCVTHSAQIAAAANEHYLILKQETESRTRTDVSLLDGTGRVEEVARLLGSGVADDTAYPHARALLDNFRHIVRRNG